MLFNESADTTVVSAAGDSTGFSGSAACGVGAGEGGTTISGASTGM